jgi:hypothetical protein
MLVELDDRLLWISRGSTDGLSDGEELAIRDLVAVAGTQQYKTAIGGTKTVPVLAVLPVTAEAIEQAAVVANLKKAKEQPDAKPSPDIDSSAE